MKMCLACDEDEYEEYLTEVYGMIRIGTLVFDADKIVRELDETAFRCGMADEECTCKEEEKEEE
jgi:hypothetical protein